MLLLLISHSVMYNSLWLRGLQHARLPCTALSHGVCSNSCPLNWWCHPTVSSSVIPFSSCPQSFPASASFSVSPPFTSSGQRIGVSASVLAMNSQGWFPLRLTVNFFLMQFFTHVKKPTTVKLHLPSSSCSWCPHEIDFYSVIILTVYLILFSHGFKGSPYLLK